MDRETFIKELKQVLTSQTYVKPFKKKGLEDTYKLHMMLAKPEDMPEMPNGENDIHICIEECSELIKSLTKILRGQGDSINLLEEMADVQVCIDMMKVIFNISYRDFQAACYVKQNRLNKIVTEKVLNEIHGKDGRVLSLEDIFKNEKCIYTEKYDVSKAVDEIIEE